MPNKGQKHGHLRGDFWGLPEKAWYELTVGSVGWVLPDEVDGTLLLQRKTCPRCWMLQTVTCYLVPDTGNKGTEELPLGRRDLADRDGERDLYCLSCFFFTVESHIKSIHRA